MLALDVTGGGGCEPRSWKRARSPYVRPVPAQRSLGRSAGDDRLSTSSNLVEPRRTAPEVHRCSSLALPWQSSDQSLSHDPECLLRKPPICSTRKLYTVSQSSASSASTTRVSTRNAFKNRIVHVEMPASQPSGQAASAAFADALRGRSTPLGATVLQEEVNVKKL